MLEIRHLTKIYRPRRGVPVKALDDVSLTFGEKGMVFLLGKSGSGKSTMLNVLGGLDRFDSGEMILKGVSAHAFKQQELDSYRNTYVGFIFQEYNNLEEFSVGANIALAIELQGRKATDEQINDILRQVDLADCASRKPSELSGGQKQRVAIARALVKNPEIIMADEPTGALDSVTGRQVLDTLKRLSADKLVLVVSHDRDFAERYADRIVELADGQVIRDVERESEDLPGEEGLAFDQDGVTVPAGYRLTEADREAINAYLAERESGAVITPRGGAKARFKETDVARLAARIGEPFRLIRSKLPMKKAFAIGASALKYKKVRLVFTLILSVIAFTLFGLSDTFGSYDLVRACTDSLRDSNVRSAALTRVEIKEDDDGDTYRHSVDLSDKDIAQLQADTGLPFTGSYAPGWMFDRPLTEQFDESVFAATDAEKKEGIAFHHYAGRINGFAEMTAEGLQDYGYTLVAGRLPEDRDEIAITSYLYESFHKGGYRMPDAPLNMAGQRSYDKIATPNNMLGRILVLGGREFSVVGIVDTGFDIDRYEVLTHVTDDMPMADEILYFALNSEMQNEVNYGMTCTAFVCEGAVAAMVAEAPYYELDDGVMLTDDEGEVYVNGFQVCSLSQIPEENILWFGGKKTLGEKEVLINAANIWEDTSEWTAAEWAEYVDRDFTMSTYYYGSGESETGWKIVGCYRFFDLDPLNGIAMALSDADLERYSNGRVYDFAVAPMPEGRALEALVSYCYDESDGVRNPLNNSACFELDILDGVFKVLSAVFFWIGVFFAQFAGLLLASFIATSITHKKQEIGILRAIGARSADVFRIFFSESFLIAMFNAVTASIATAVVTFFINFFFRSEGLLVTVLHFGVRQVILLLVISVAVAALASFFPVRRIAAKRPIDAINNR